MLSPDSAEGSTESPAVEGRETAGTFMLFRWSHAPSSSGFGSSEGSDCQEGSAVNVRDVVMFYDTIGLRAILLLVMICFAGIK